jgi:hypothetical protein
MSGIINKKPRRRVPKEKKTGLNEWQHEEPLRKLLDEKSLRGTMSIISNLFPKGVLTARVISPSRVVVQIDLTLEPPKGE